ncbi:MAG: enoyl-CoA hydratase/isomerase family protein [Bacteroidia bacterium]
MEYQYIECSIRERVGYITLNRTDKRNALNDVFVKELMHAVLLAEQTPEVKVVILNAKGSVFCAGADLEMLQKMQAYSLEENFHDSSALAELFKLIYRSSKVYIAQIEGHAIAGGCGLATICDFAFAVPEAKFGYTEVRIGFVPAIVMFFLIRKIGETRAKEMLLSGDLISATEAVQYHLINKTIPADEIQTKVFEFAQKLCTKNSEASMQLTKKMIADIQLFPIEEGLQFAAKMNAYARATDDCKRGIAAFLNKEEIVW